MGEDLLNSKTTLRLTEFQRQPSVDVKKDQGFFSR
jgi:hypothetical protein